MVYGMAWQTRMVYSMAWQALHGIMVWPGLAWHGIWYGVAGIAWYMVWPGGHHMVYGSARHGACHSIWYGLAGMAWCMVWPGRQ